MLVYKKPNRIMCVHYLYSTYSALFPSWWWNNWQKSQTKTQTSVLPHWKFWAASKLTPVVPHLAENLESACDKQEHRQKGQEHSWYVSCMDHIKHRCFSVFFGISWSSFLWTNLVRSKFTSNRDFPSTNLCVAAFRPYIPELVKVKPSLPCFKPILFQSG